MHLHTHIPSTSFATSIFAYRFILHKKKLKSSPLVNTADLCNNVHRGVDLPTMQSSKYIFEKSSISASKIPVTPICHGTLSRNFFERFDFVTKKVRFRDKPIFSLTHKIQFSDK